MLGTTGRATSERGSMMLLQLKQIPFYTPHKKVRDKGSIAHSDSRREFPREVICL